MDLKDTKYAIIIGAGPAGLTAAYELLCLTDYIPIVIESDIQVGGISKTVDFKGNKIDIGGHRFFSKSKRVIDWWLHFLPLKIDAGQQDVLIRYQNKVAQINTSALNGGFIPAMLLRSRKSRILFEKKFFDYPLRLNILTIRGLGLIKIVRCGFSYIYARLFPIKAERNLAQFFINKFGNELYLTFFKDYTEKVWGVECTDISAEWGSQRVKDLNITRVVKHAIKAFFINDKTLNQQSTSTSLIEQFMYPMYGPGQMWDTVANVIKSKGGHILLKSEINSINFDKSQRVISVTLKNLDSNLERSLEGDVFFSTMPIKNLILNSRGICFPQSIIDIATGLQYRDFLIVGLLLDKLLYTEGNMNNKIRDNWIYLQDKGIKAGRVQIFNNWSPFMVKDSGKVWIGVEFFCNEQEAFWKQSDAEIIEHAVNEMKLIGLIDEKDVEDSIVLKVLKAYPSYNGSYHRFEELKSCLDGISNLYCIGRNGMHKYNNMDHSMLTAMEAVKHLHSGQGSKRDIWEVNTEENYHEESN